MRKEIPNVICFFRITVSLLLVVLMPNNWFDGVIFSLALTEIYKEKHSDSNSDSNKLAFCVAGLLNQPETAFKHINIPGYTKVYVKFSPFGYSGATMGKTINALRQDEDIILGISIGSLATLNAKMDKAILINPCCNAKMLKKSLYWLIKIFSPIAEIISLTLGWFSFIPIIPAQEGHYSLALLIDQLFNMGYGHMTNNPHTQTKIIISKKDEFLINEEIIRYFKKKDPLCGIANIDTMHARIGDPKDAPKYQAAIDYFLKEQEQIIS